jgi:hypothetical protein
MVVVQYNVLSIIKEEIKMTKYMGVTIQAGGINSSQFGLGTGSVAETYSVAAGDNTLVDVNNTTSIYYGDSYGQGVVQTKRLYDSSTAITSLLINEMSSLFVGTRGTVNVSFDDGNSWSTATNNIGDTITSFTGTSADGGIYKLKLKFTLGASYGETGSYAWVTTSSLNVHRVALRGCGTTSNALSFGGYTGATVRVNSAEIWSGTAWATTAVLTEAKNIMAACGTTSAALCYGGYTADANVDTTEKWLGTSWVTTTVLTEAKRALAGCGTTAAALCYGGYAAGSVDTTEIWAGSTWVTTGNLTSANYNSTGCGTAAAALIMGGYTGADSNITEIWNGSIWATTTSLTAILDNHSAVGTTSAALIYGSTGTEIWDGSIWVTAGDLTSNRSSTAGAGTSVDALCIGGTTATGLTERWINTGIQRGFSAKIN